MAAISQYLDFGRVHMAVIASNTAFNCWHCDAPMAEPTDLLTVIQWTEQPQTVVCEACSMRKFATGDY